jgi:hypothetical protein
MAYAKVGDRNRGQQAFQAAFKQIPNFQKPGCPSDAGDGTPTIRKYSVTCLKPHAARQMPISTKSKTSAIVQTFWTGQQLQVAEKAGLTIWKTKCAVPDTV